MVKTIMNPTMFCCLILAMLSTIHAKAEFGPSLKKPSGNPLEIRLYLQDVLVGPNKTVWEIAHANITSSSKSSFGLSRVVDDLITAAPDRRSRKLGRAQGVGVITFADIQESALNMNINFHFTWGHLKGSSLCILGRNPMSERDLELPVVGGTGVFRMARGYAISNTYSYDVKTSYGVIEYVVYVIDHWGGKQQLASS